MSIEILSEKLTALKESNNQLNKLIDQLANSSFEPISVPLHDLSSDNIVVQLASEILQSMIEQEEDLELLQEEVLDFVDNSGGGGDDIRKLANQSTQQQHGKLLDGIKDAIEVLKKSQTFYRQAQLRAFRKLQAAQKEKRLCLTRSHTEDRPILFAHNNLPIILNNSSHTADTSKKHPLPLSEEEKEINSSSDVTAALRHTHEMMVNELSRSQFAHETLKESTAALAQLSETYSTLDTLLSTSRNLLGTLFRSQKSDTWYLETAFYILLATLCWLIFRRLLYGPLMWFFWYPMKIFIKSWSRVLNALGLEVF